MKYYELFPISTYFDELFISETFTTKQANIRNNKITNAISSLDKKRKSENQTKLNLTNKTQKRKEAETKLYKAQSTSDTKKQQVAKKQPKQPVIRPIKPI